ncbi:MAG: 4Fe-4S dicluster domain-containing protein [Bacteroidota bacterium]
MAKIQGAIEIDTERCKGCVLCVDACPTQVISMAQEVNSKGYHFAFPSAHSKCIGCANCAVICPDGVITVYKQKVEA